MSTPTVTVITGPPGVDIGPAVAHIGRNLGDGLAVRTVRSEPELANGLAFSRRGSHDHTGPVPGYFGGTLAEGYREHGLPLWNVPSCWQNPDTNLGVAYTGAVTRDLAFDCHTLEEIGCDVKHRLTVQYRAVTRAGALSVPPPIEVGDLGTAARDSVLRGADGGSRHVLVEAGDGQTFIDAMQAVGLAPNSPHIERLDRWLVVNAPLPDTDGRKFVHDIGQELIVNGGGRHAADGTPQPARGVQLAVLGLHRLFPQVTGLDTPDGLAGEREAVAWLLDVSGATGARVTLISTADGPAGPWLDLP